MSERRWIIGTDVLLYLSVGGFGDSCVAVLEFLFLQGKKKASRGKHD